ncbi:hypothetical protein BDU57DRAFT_496516 [Ampelomyces quisqualis]|uniref:Uncharacterized protein n=1 Tax=Ampelomyces quisqualis TaxID=50730 RepID=A0A6A5QNA2_AMPQU|nr:hypothetical protein BDU57DRAFT_496516 [Ampelomyces quisqualis]
MSDTEAAKAKSSWTDKERLTYLFALIDNSNIKFDYNSTPRPAGRSIIACQRMMDRLKSTVKPDLAALTNTAPIQALTPRKPAAPGTPKSTGRKRKANHAEVDATPTKRGRNESAVERAPHGKEEPEGEPDFAVEDEGEV